MPYKPEEREYRNMRMETRKNEEDKEKTYIVRGYATTYDDPYCLWSEGDTDYFEQVSKEAFDDKTDTSDVIFQLNHTGMVYARNRNKTLSFGSDDHGLWIEADLSLTEESRKIYDAIDKGLIDQMSFAFTVDSEEWDKKTHTRTIKHIKKLYDVSAVSCPANPGTEISARSAFEGYIEAEKLEKLEAERRDKQRQKIRILTEVSKWN